MAGTVSAHQLSSYANPQAGQAAQASVVLGNDNTTVTSYNAHDSDATIHLQNSTNASKPAAGTAQRVWLSNDVGAIYLWYDTGSTWSEVNYLRNTGGTITSTTTPQFTVAYDGTHSATFSVSSAGALTINATSTITITPAVTLAAALTYGGVTLSNAVTGTGKMVLSNAPTFDAGATFAGAISGVTTLSVSGTFTTTGGSQSFAASQGQIFFSSGALRFQSEGANSSTNGAFQFTSYRSDGSNGLDVLIIANDGGLYTGAATGASKGNGTLNVSGGVYLNGTAYTNPDYVLEHAFTGRIVKFADKIGAREYAGLRPLSDVLSFAKKNYRLPLMDAMIQRTKGGELFAGSDALLATVEEAYLYLGQHDARLASHDSDLASLKAWATTQGWTS